MKPIMITKKDYFNQYGINLDLEFRNTNLSDDGTSGADVFLKNVCEDTWDYLRYKFVFDEKDFEELCEREPEVIDEYKKGLLLQIRYILNSGEAGSNVNSEALELSPQAKRKFRSIGLCNIQVIRPHWRNWRY